MRVLVTGAGGFLGRKTVARLRDGGHEVLALVRTPGKHRFLPPGTRVFFGDITLGDTIARPLAEAEAVVHLAAIVSFGNRDPSLVYRVNIDGTLNLLKLAQERGIKRFVYIGSVAACGQGNGDCLGSRQAFPCAYERSKHLTERMIRQRYPWVISLLPGVIYGPDSLVNMLLDMVIAGRLPGFIAGENHIPLVHLDDAADAVRLVMERGEGGQYLCVAHCPTLKELGKALFAVRGKRGVLVKPWVLKLAGGPVPSFLSALGFRPALNPASVRMILRDWHFSSDRLRALGWRPRPFP